MINFLLFCFAAVGMMSILTTSSLFNWARGLVKKHCPIWVCQAIHCPQCVGTWTGFLCGYFLLSTSPFLILMCGCASSVFCQIYYYFQLYMLSIIPAEVLFEASEGCENESEQFESKETE